MSTTYLKRAVTAVVTAGLTLVSTAAAEGSAYEAPLERAGGEVLAGQYIVVLKNQAKGTEVAQRHKVSATSVYSHALSGFAATLSPAQLKTVRADRTVAYVVPDGVVRALGKPTPEPPRVKPSGTRRTGPVIDRNGAASTTPRAVQASAPWGLDRIDQRTRNRDGQYRYVATGSGVTAFVLDTGIQASHNQFGGRVIQGYDAIGDGRGTNDCYGHGTQVAGVIGGATYGVAKQVRLVPVRVLNCDGTGTSSAVIAGVDFVTGARSGPSVANMSLGGGYTKALNDAVSASIASGVTYTVAAGNFNGDACTLSPASVPAALTVGASDVLDRRASFSNWGPCVDLFAPGEKIPSASIGSSTATATSSGTSLASPHVAGLAALYLQVAPTATTATVSSVLLNAAVPDVLTDPAGSPNRLARKWTGTMPNGRAAFQEPDGTFWHQAGTGTITASLEGTAGTDQDLYLWWWDGNAWQAVAGSASASASERVVLSGRSGYFTLMVENYAGAGTYDLWLSRPS
ncbi:S8 family peptidase [Kineosporia babensis]|uniref:S8 family peptidase n=1 Tax=Kineosporia babensis TaxID=499548 RepID=A0A9X1SXW9_9ACTN|nr:S8 family peptidase [Kineosporia babensis]MCD5316647.1 S8 family peptidase [Kineosporia babensis]